MRRGERHFVRGVVHDKAVLVTDTRIKGHQFRAELFLHIVHQRLCVLGRYFGRSVVNHRLLLIRFVGGKRHEIAAESKIRFAHFYTETSCFKRRTPRKVNARVIAYNAKISYLRTALAAVGSDVQHTEFAFFRKRVDTGLFRNLKRRFSVQFGNGIIRRSVGQNN